MALPTAARIDFALGSLIGVCLFALASCGGDSSHATPKPSAQPPADIEAALVKIGPIVDPVCTAKLYRPLMPKNDITSGIAQPYPGITVTRNQSFGKDPKDVVDIFSAQKGPARRTVLVYVPGGAGNKIEIQDKSANAFYDNIGRFATQHRMVGVLMQRKASSSHWLKTQSVFPRFESWQDGYAAFTVSYGEKDGLIEYVKGQEEQVRKYSSQLADNEVELAKIRDQRHTLELRKANLDEQVRKAVDELQF